MMNLEKAKRAAAAKAATLIEKGMLVGLGSGSTARYFIEELSQRVKTEGLLLQTVASSLSSAKLAKEKGLCVLDIDAVSHIDLTVDGADEIDPQKRMIKGGGGAHVREKILASSSQEMVVILDESKRVPQLGRAKLPVEVLCFGHLATQKKIEALGYTGKWRNAEEDSFFLTENGGFLFDIQFPFPPPSPEKVHEELIRLPGVVDTGFFFGLAGRVFVGLREGRVLSI